MTIHTLQLGMEWFTEFPGGLNRVYAHLLFELARQDVESLGLVAGSPDVKRLSGGLAAAFAPFDAPLMQRMRAIRAASTDWLAAHAGDGVIVSHFALNALPLLDRLGSRPFVVHFQGPWGDESRIEGASALSAGAKTVLERAVYRRANASIVLSSAFREILVTRFGVRRESVHLIPGGVEMARFDHATSRPESRAILGWPADRRIVLCVRRLVRRVGLDILIDACVELKRTVPDVLVLIAGTGPLGSELQQRISAHGLEDVVKLIGYVPDEQLPLAYRAADLTVVPTIALEGFGLITVESLAAGTPCVVTPVDALSEIVAPLSPALVASSATAGALATTIGDALTARIPLPSASECADYARKHYDWPVIASQVRKVYERVLQ